MKAPQGQEKTWLQKLCTPCLHDAISPLSLDCGSMQSSMAGSELFGHSKGAFTDAKRDRLGAFEEADGGTLFLDEIGELDLGLQPKLLHVLERHEVKRLGENKYRPVNVRVIAATNRKLDKEMAAGHFREDLFYRLSVVRLRMPALNERREDIGLLARSFIQKLRPQLDPLVSVGLGPELCCGHNPSLWWT